MYVEQEQEQLHVRSYRPSHQQPQQTQDIEAVPHYSGLRRISRH